MTMPNFEPNDPIFFDRIRRGKAMSVEEKVLAGARLFDEAAARIKDGIRMQFPGWSLDQIEDEFRRRLRIQRILNDRGVFTYDANGVNR